MTTAGKMTVNGVSTCAVGQEKYERFEGAPGKWFYYYDYRHTDGTLYSTVLPTLEKCREGRDKWLIIKRLRNSTRQEIRQDGLAVAWSGDGISMAITFSNLTGTGITDPDEYRAYVLSRMEIAALNYGEIELIADGETVATGTIRETI
jgi:hypothetical protein